MQQPPSEYQFYFDQYQRYRDIQVVVEQISAHLNDRSLRVLDVGGTELSQQFLPSHQVFAANVEAGSALALQCSGMELPFADSSFDVVITADTLEHIPGDQRAAFVSELARVADAYVVITGPFANGMNEEAERLLNEFLESVLGVRHRYLAEHLAYGLPDMAQTRQWLETAAGPAVTVPSGYTTRWLPLMLIRFYLTQLPDGDALTATLEAMYNHRFYWRDHKEPSYRKILAAAKHGDPVVLQNIAGVFTDAAPDEFDLNSLIALWQATVGMQALESRDRRIAELEAEARQLQDLRGQIQQLHTVVRAYESGRFIRTMAWLKHTRQQFLP